MRTLMLLALTGLFAGFAVAQDPAPGAKKEVEKKNEATADAAGGTKKKVEEPAGPEFGEGAEKIWAAWERMEYHLGKAGVKTCSYKITAEVTAMGQTMNGVASYSWDGKIGTLKWDNPQLGAMLGQQGWNSKTMDSSYKDKASRASLAGCKLVLKSEETRDVLQVEGTPTTPVRSFVFDKEGVLRSWVMAVPDQMGGTQKVDFLMNYEKVGEKYISTGWSFTLDTGQMGKYSETTKMTIEKRGDYHVIVKAESTGTMGGQEAVRKLLTFSDWKFNEDATATEKKKETEKKPAGQ